MKNEEAKTSWWCSIQIDKIEFADKLFKFVNNVADVACKLLIDKVELVDKFFILLKMVADVAF